MVSGECQQACHQILVALHKTVKATLDKLGAGFHCGAYTGPSLDEFFNELRTELQLTDSSSSRFWPTLQYDARRNFYVLKVPRSRLRAHGNFKKVSYLLRAHADFNLQGLVVNAAERNDMGWAFSDEVRFGSFIKFGQQLAHVGSFERLHDDDISLSQVLAFIARHFAGASLVSLYGLTRSFHDNLSSYNLVRHRFIGRREPHFDQLFWAHNSGWHDITLPQPQHLVVDDDDGDQTILVTDSVWSDVDETGEDRVPLVSITRTVVWSNDRRGRHGFRHTHDDEHKFAQPVH